MKQHRKIYSQNLEKCKRATPKIFKCHLKAALKNYLVESGYGRFFLKTLDQSDLSLFF
jgi:hypothetical protein